MSRTNFLINYQYSLSPYTGDRYTSKPYVTDILAVYYVRPILPRLPDICSLAVSFTWNFLTGCLVLRPKWPIYETCIFCKKNIFNRHPYFLYNGLNGRTYKIFNLLIDSPMFWITVKTAVKWDLQLCDKKYL